jgi:hypothetical protein
MLWDGCIWIYAVTEGRALIRSWVVGWTHVSLKAKAVREYLIKSHCVVGWVISIDSPMWMSAVLPL